MRRYAAGFAVLGFLLSTAVSWAEEAPLYTKVFKVDANTFVQNLANVSDVNLRPGMTTSGGNGGGASSGVTKRSSTVDANKMIRTYFTEAGVDLAPPKIVFFNDRLGEILVRASLQDLELIQQEVELLNQPPRQLTIEAKFVEMDEASLRELGFDWAKPGKDFTAILTDSQFRSALATIKQRSGADDLSAPKISTLSGRQTHISSTNGDGFGSVLDVMPTVSADGFSIQMVLIPTILEFIGYDIPGTGNIPNSVPQAQAAAGVPIQATPPLPHYRVREVATTCNIWDGQTVVLGRVMTNQPPKTRMVRMVFVTATIIDAAGNRVHTDEEISNAASHSGDKK